MTNEWDVTSALVVVAHPDDVDFGAAGTVARLTASGAKVTYCIVTDGDAGAVDTSIDRSTLPSTRRAEQTEAARAVGVRDLGFLGHPDGRVVADLDLRRDISRVIREVRPDLVLCPSPQRNYMRLPASHPDHLAVGEAAICAVYPDARNAFAFPELLDQGLEPHTVAKVWFMAAPEPNHVVDITAHIDQKIAALFCHKSQIPDPAAVEARVREWTGLAAKQAGFGEGHFAETFLAVELPW